MKKIKILTVFGTRPEAIKMAPLIKALKAADFVECAVCVTGQHREMLDQVLQLFSIKPDYDLNIMQKAQTLSSVTEKILNEMDQVLSDCQPNLVLVHGDTSTTFAAALSCFYHKIDIGHVEAGLRTGHMYSPWPEEINRKLTTGLSAYHFAPTETAKQNLLKENVNSDDILVTGNTVIDALLYARQCMMNDINVANEAKKPFENVDFSKNIILVTGHRRENHGTGFENICTALENLAVSDHNIEIVFPVHLNPKVKGPVTKHLSKHSNIHLLPPLEYLPGVDLMSKSSLILTDSGGIQEEAPALGKPVLVMRETTERPEALNAKTVKLVGSSSTKIYEAVIELLENPASYEEMVKSKNPYGDGTSSKKIVEHLYNKYFQT